MDKRPATFEITRKEASVLLDNLTVWMNISRVTKDGDSGYKLAPFDYAAMEQLMKALEEFFEVEK